MPAKAKAKKKKVRKNKQSLDSLPSNKVCRHRRVFENIKKKKKKRSINSAFGYIECITFEASLEKAFLRKRNDYNTTCILDDVSEIKRRAKKRKIR